MTEQTDDVYLIPSMDRTESRLDAIESFLDYEWPIIGQPLDAVEQLYDRIQKDDPTWTKFDRMTRLERTLFLLPIAKELFQND
jgi:hypothetical protein